MKRTFLSLLALIAMGTTAFAGDKPVISVADVEALPGETVSFSVNLEDGKADKYTAMTLYAYFPTTGFTTTGKYTVSDVWPGTMAVVGDIGVKEPGLATIPFASANEIPGSAVQNLVTVEFTVGASVAIGEYDVTLKGTMFEYNLSDKDYADDVTFKVKVVNVHNVVLDENATVAPAAATGVNVTVKRTINANEWSTICLPFAMTEAQVKTAFGDDVQLADFAGYEAETNTDEEITGIKVKFNSGITAIEANHPYAIKVSSAVTEFSAEGVDINPEEEPTVAAIKRTKKQWSEMIGTYVADTPIGENCLFLSGNKFWYSKGSTKMKAFRAYFDFYDVLTEVEGAGARGIEFDFNNATGIQNIKGKTQNDGIYYDLSGRRVEKPTKGIYIVNGKKVVLK